MIKLTKQEGKTIYMSPDQVIFIEAVDDVTMLGARGDRVCVIETPEEVAKKVLEYKLVFEQYRQSYASASQHHHDAQVLFEQAERDLVRLAGLEDTQ